MLYLCFRSKCFGFLLRTRADFSPRNVELIFFSLIIKIEVGLRITLYWNDLVGIFGSSALRSYRRFETMTYLAVGRATEHFFYHGQNYRSYNTTD